MSKAVLINIKPKWCEMIANGKKTVEVRKSMPRIDPPFKCYIYCTKPSIKHRTICGCMMLNDDELYRHPTAGIKYGDSIELMCCDDYTQDNFLNGKVIGEFMCDWIKGVKCDSLPQAAYNRRQNTCLSDEEIMQYANNGKLYYWHISDLKIYDRPKELSEFQVKRPPLSWQYVEECEDNA